MRGKVAALGFGVLLVAFPIHAKITTIEFVCNDSVEIRKGAYERAVKTFEASHPDIKVKYTLMNNGDFVTYLLTRAAGGSMPDVFYNRCQFTNVFASRGLIKNLDSLIKRDKVDLSDLWASQIPELTYNGSYYCMPENYSTTAVTYNLDMANEAGIVLPNTPWSWDDLWLAATKLTKKDGTKTSRYGFQTGGDNWTELGLFYGKSGSVYGPGNKTLAMNVPANVNLLEKFGEMRDKGVMSALGADFAGKKVAMALDGSWTVDIWRKQLKGNHFNLAFLPDGDFSHAPSASNTGASYAISALSKKVDASWEWVKYLTSAECEQYVVVDKLLTVPSRKSTAKDFIAKVKATGDPKDAQVWLESSERGWSIPSTPYHDALIKSLGDELAKVALKKKSAAAALQAIDQQVNEVMRRKQKK